MTSVSVVDDDAAMATVTARRSRGRGCEVRTARSGLAERPADVVILDLGTPGMSGVETLAAIRSDPAPAATRTLLLAAVLDLA